MAAKIKSKTEKKDKELDTAVKNRQNEEISDEGDDEGSDVDEEGLEKLMKMLGENELDDIAKMQLDVLSAGQDGDSDVEDGEEEGEEIEDIDDEDAKSEDEEAENENELEEDSDELNEDEDEDVDVDVDIEGEGVNEVALDDVESVDEDAVPRQKLLINNKAALERILETIELDTSLPWTETLVVTYPETITVDVNDDINRELAFYKQALDGANKARDLAQKHGLPFTRPPDYFAEMVKSDSHMERIRQRLLDEKATIKKSEERRKEKEGKKFGKQIQLEKLKERERSKKEMSQKLKDLKRKRKDVLDDSNPNGDDAFDVAVEDAIADRPSKRPNTGKNISRKARDTKFGFGGRGKRSKQNTRASTEQFDFGSRKLGGGRGGRGGRGGTKRLGKSRRMATRGR